MINSPRCLFIVDLKIKKMRMLNESALTQIDSLTEIMLIFNLLYLPSQANTINSVSGSIVNSRTSGCAVKCNVYRSHCKLIQRKLLVNSASHRKIMKVTSNNLLFST